MKDQSIAKLCAQCEEYYLEALKMMERESIMMSLDKDWTSYVNIIVSMIKLFLKIMYFKML